MSVSYPADARRKAERRSLLKAHEAGAHRESQHPRCPACRVAGQGQNREPEGGR